MSSEVKVEDGMTFFPGILNGARPKESENILLFSAFEGHVSRAFGLTIRDSQDLRGVFLSAQNLIPAVNISHICQ
jgi:hypothetical protein